MAKIHCRSPPKFDLKNSSRMEEIKVKEDSKCFIKIENGIYEEITYKELLKRERDSVIYRRKKFIEIEEILLEVSINDYQNYYREMERNKYCEKVLEKLSVISIEELCTNEEIRGIDIIEDQECNIVNETIRKIEIEKLKDALLSLDVQEYEIIKNLFFEEKTLREYAEMLNIPFTTIESRKLKILEKLKKFLEN